MMKPDDLLEVYSTDSTNDADVLRNALHAEGIKCEIDGEHQAGLAGIGIMEIKLLVRAEDFDRARSYVERHEQRN
jgi:hypothetical protein